jgi:chromate reductase
VLKNALDWISRVRPVPLVGKPVAVVSAAAGQAGGQRATAGLYLMLIPFKVRLVAEAEVAIGNAGNRFDAQGRLSDEALAGMLEKQIQALRAAI